MWEGEIDKVVACEPSDCGNYFSYCLLEYIFANDTLHWICSII